MSFCPSCFTFLPQIPWMLSCFTEITVRRSISTFLSLSSNRVDFLPCSLMSNFPLSKALDALKTGRPFGVSSLLLFCPTLCLAHQNKSCTTSRSLERPMSAMESASMLPNFNSILIIILLYCRSLHHIISSNMDMKMILPLIC